jgi:phosphoglycerate-specific signal transduction histidine kinase
MDGDDAMQIRDELRRIASALELLAEEVNHLRGEVRGMKERR